MEMSRSYSEEMLESGRVTESKMPGIVLRGGDVVSMGNILTNPKTTVLREDINLLIERSH